MQTCRLLFAVIKQQPKAYFIFLLSTRLSSWDNRNRITEIVFRRSDRWLVPIIFPPVLKLPHVMVNRKQKTVIVSLFSTN